MIEFIADGLTLNEAFAHPACKPVTGVRPRLAATPAVGRAHKRAENAATVYVLSTRVCACEQRGGGKCRAASVSLTSLNEPYSISPKPDRPQPKQREESRHEETRRRQGMTWSKGIMCPAMHPAWIPAHRAGA